MRLLLAKLLCLGAAFVLMLGGSLLPVRLARGGRGAGKSGPRSRRALSLCNAFAAGVFLATGFNALLPAVRDKMSEVLRLGQVSTDYPLAETLMLSGFFLTVLVEQLVLTFRTEKPPFIDLETFNAGGSSEAGSDSEDESPFLEGGAGAAHRRHRHPGLSAAEASGAGPLRLLGLALALSAHSAFEGLALGLQEEGGRLLGLFLGVALHEGLVAAALGLNMARAGLGLREAVRAALPLSLALPAGIGAGAAVQGAASASASLAGAVASVLLQGLAAGTFLFVTFFEILGRELQAPADRLLKVLCLVLGYALLAGLAFLKG